MELLLLPLGLWAAFRILRSLTATSAAMAAVSAAATAQSRAIADARIAVAEMERDLAALRRDLRDLGDGEGEGPIPPGAPDPLADFMARRAVGSVE